MVPTLGSTILSLPYFIKRVNDTFVLPGGAIVHFKVVHLALSISCDGPIRGGYTIVGTFMVLWQPSGYTIVGPEIPPSFEPPWNIKAVNIIPPKQ